MNKKITALVLALGMSATMLGATSCGKQTKDEANTIQIYAVNLGYGVEWLEKAGEAFLQEDWVKEKYSGWKVDVDDTVDAGQAVNMISGGEAANPYELIFTTQPANSVYEKKYLAELSDVLEKTIPGEDITVKNKMKSTILQDSQSRMLDGSTKVYGISWVDSTPGIFVNNDYITSAFTGTSYASKYVTNTWEPKLPVTTDKLVDMLTELVEVTDGEKPIVSCTPVNYWAEMFDIWFAQYEGVETYRNFWWGQNNDGEQDAQIFSLQGRLRSLETMESIIGYNHGFTRDDNEYNSYLQAQQLFVEKNAGAIMVNGDWLHHEMGGKFSSKITMMKTPVISSIIERDEFENITNDDELAFVVECVDKCDKDATYGYANAKAEYKEKFNKDLKESEYDRIFEARNVKGRLGGHQAHIPAHSKNIEAAKDFLLFLASNKGIEVMMQYTGGISAYKYDVENENPTLYAGFTDIQKSVLKYSWNAQTIMDYQSSPLNYLGGILRIPNNTDIERRFMSASAGNRVSPQKVFSNIEEYFQSNNAAKFIAALEIAGLR